MSKKIKVYDANGRFLRILKDGEIVQDGEVMRVELTALDGLDPMQRLVVQDSMTPTAPRHSPGYVQLADSADDRMEQYADRRQRIADQWKHAPPLLATEQRASPAVTSGTIDARDSVYDKRDRQLENAWRGA